MTQKMEKKNVNPKIENSRKVKNYLDHANFPLDYHSKNDLKLIMMFIVEIKNRKAHVKIKDDIWNAKTTVHNVLIGF